jgi:NAD(P)-dependent dehydrogenase (short-subunit alcohol dehydrogenase family)
VASLTANLARDLAPHGITANTIHPSHVRTERRSSAVSTPMGRQVEPQDVANAVLYFVSEGASAVSGQVLVVDGGREGAVHL